jgi:succinate dehydrogenase/fumarate reductase flavoprotein subunit
MNQEKWNLAGQEITVISLNTVVVGSGAAGFNAADRLYQYGQRDIAIITEGINSGTSRNTGSDKQTYYKLSLAGGEGDSVKELAQTLYAGQCVDGDHALAEAALSAQCFLKLVELGVAFPQSRYGEFIGYKTDHDPRRRATSAGPYTSKMMTEKLEDAVKAKGITLFDQMLVIAILVNEQKLYGLLCLDLSRTGNEQPRFIAFNCRNVIYATGGPAGIYADSVYPTSHAGSSGIAFAAGITGKNLTEWQYGLASVNPRWNVSGTYMQVLPCFISTDAQGQDEREFLTDYFTDKNELLSKVFLKGYQWPFDVRKVDGGSSIIDILVYIETCLKGRKVYLDFRRNPFHGDIDFAALSPEAYEYLKKAGAVFGTPIDRLRHMNNPAIEMYQSKGMDITKEPLEIALCAQHNNGGLGIDRWWQTNLPGFYAAGEVSASHGVYRPGGSALNAGQVGSTRAAQYIARNGQGQAASLDQFQAAVQEQVAWTVTLGQDMSCNEDNLAHLDNKAQKRMSACGAAIRNQEQIAATLQEIGEEVAHFRQLVKISDLSKLPGVYRLHDKLICQFVYLSAMLDYAQNGGKSRGSALYYAADGQKAYDFLAETFRFSLDDGSRGKLVQEVLYRDGQCHFNWREIRAIPSEDDFFENVWRSFRENGNCY